MDENIKERLNNRLTNSKQLSAEQVSAVIEFLQHERPIHLGATSTGLLRGGDAFPFPDIKTILNAPKDAINSILEPILIALKKAPVYCCIGLSGRAPHHGIEGQTSLGYPSTACNCCLPPRNMRQ